MQHVAPHEVVYAVVFEIRREPRHLRAAAGVRGHRLFGLAVLHQFNAAEEADVAHVAHRGVLGLEIVHQASHHPTHALRVADNVVFLHHAQNCDCGGEAHGVRAVRQAAVENSVFVVVGDLVADGNRTQRHVGRGEALRHRDEIGHDLPVIHREPLARAPQPGHDFVADEQDAVLVADLAQALQVAIGRDDDAVRAGDRFEEEGSHGVRAFAHQHLLDLIEALAGEYFVAVALVIQRAAILVRVEDVDDAGDAGLVGPAALVAGEGDGPRSCAVIRAIAGDDLLPPGELPRHFDRVLVGFGPAEGEEEFLEVARHHFGQFPADLGAYSRGHAWPGVHQLFGLRFDRVNYAPVAVADVDAHQLRVEIEVSLAVGVPEVDAFALRHRDRVDGALRRPRKERMLFGEFYDFFGGHEVISFR